MPEKDCISENLVRLRLDRGLTQAALAERAGMSRVAVGRIERGAAQPRGATLTALARALDARFGDLVTPVRPLRSVRFRAHARMRGREQILAEVSRWLEAYAWLEADLEARLEFPFPRREGAEGPKEMARAARKAAGLDAREPVRDICGLLEGHGTKVLRMDKRRDSFFGLSVLEEDGGPAVVVNTWDRISVERWIFTAAHELGHILLHPLEFVRDATALPTDAEHEADAFASEFLMPEAAFGPAWDRTRGHALLVRALKVKRIFRVSYRTVLYRLVETGRASRKVWAAWQMQYQRRYGRTLGKADEPEALARSEFAWNWNRAGEPAGLSEHDFVEDRLWALVRQALETERISMGRGAEILGIHLEDLREWVGEWAG